MHDKESAVLAGRQSSSQRPRRILVVAPEPFFEDRGTPIALRNILEAASGLGFQIDLLTFPVGEPVVLPGLCIIRVGAWLPIRRVPIGFSFRKVILDLCLAPALIQRARRGGYDFIYALEEAAPLAQALRRWHRLPIVYDMQSSLPEQLKAHPILGRPGIQRLLLRIERWVIRGADRVVCSAGLRSHVLSIAPTADVREWNFPAEPAPVGREEPNRLREKLDIGPGARVVLYAGNFEAYQGLELLLSAVPGVLTEVPGAVFVLVGANGRSRITGSKVVAALREQGFVKIVARRPKSEMPGFLALADVVVSPRENIGNIGLKVFEYMAAGKAIVATDTPAHRSVLDDERAVLVDPSPDAMGAAIARLLRDPAARSRLGEAARSYAEANLSRGNFAEQVALLYSLEKQ
jgi:glycosyltransferase involved in cell wall biosynthesis